MSHYRDSTGRIFARTPGLERRAAELGLEPCDAKGRLVVVDVPWTWVDPEQDLDEAIREGLAAGLSMSEIARRADVDKATVSRHARRLEVNHE